MIKIIQDIFGWILSLFRREKIDVKKLSKKERLKFSDYFINKYK